MDPRSPRNWILPALIVAVLLAGGIGAWALYAGLTAAAPKSGFERGEAFTLEPKASSGTTASVATTASAMASSTLGTPTIAPPSGPWQASQPKLSRPRISWVLLGSESARKVFADKLGLSSGQISSAVSVARTLSSAESAFLEASSNETIDFRMTPKAAEIAAGYNRKTDAATDKAMNDLVGATGRSRSEVQSALEAAWAGEVERYREAVGFNNINKALGVSAYRVIATSFTDMSGEGVAVPDRYIKFSGEGGGQIPDAQRAGYSVGSWTVGMQYGGQTVTGQKVVDTGPWNTDDNYWNSRFDPERPRRMFADLPQGMPESTAAFFDDYNGGNDQFGRRVLNPAGLDVLWPTARKLGISPPFRDWVTVWFEWEPKATRAPVKEQRVAARNRYATSVAVSRRQWPNGAPAVVLATGADFPDALAAGPLAAAYKGPVLLVPPTGLTAVQTAELTRLHPRQVIIVGSTAAVPASVDQAAKAIASGPSVSRIGGADRYETAALVSRALRGAGPAPARVVVATGESFPDALAIGPVAAANRWPVLLTKPDELPASTAQALANAPKYGTVVVGGPGAVGDAVVAKLPSPVRLGGSDRYATADAVAAWAAQNGFASFGYVAMATGSGYADALSAVPMAAARKGVVLLTGRGGPAETTRQLLAKQGAKVAVIDAVGGPAAVPDAAMQAIHPLLRP